MWVKMNQICSLVFVCIVLFHDGINAASFSIEEQYPPMPSGSEPLYIKKGKTLTLSCSSNAEFNLCQWVRPGSLSCAIFNSEDSKACPHHDDIVGTSDWEIRKDSKHKCSMIIQSVSEAEEGKWNCQLQSLPNGKSSVKEKDERNFRIKILQPAVVTIDGPNELTLSPGIEEFLSCSAEGNPKPTNVEWRVDDSPLTPTTKMTDDHNRPNVLKEKIGVIFPDNSWSGKRIECRSTQLDAENDEVISRYTIAKHNSLWYNTFFA